MNLLQTIIWLFPILFMIHDFDEIILLKAYQKRNTAYIQTLRTKKKYIPFGFEATTPVFSIAVAIEFIIFSIISLLSILFESYYVWYLFHLGYTAHLLFHMKMWIGFKRYVPGAATSLLFFPISCYFIYIITIMLDYSLTTLLIFIPLSLILTVAWLYIAHKGMKLFGLWLDKYESYSSI